MKAILLKAAMIPGIVIGLSFAPLARGGTPTAPAPAASDTNCTGIASAVNQKDKTVTIKQFLSDRTFNVADNCKIVMADKSSGSLSDLRPGQKLEVRFQKERGVLIAYQINQQNVTFTGYIDMINTPGRLLIVKSGLVSRHFMLSKDCALTVEGNKSGSLDDLKPGQTISVNYEEQNDKNVARSIDRQGMMSSGTLEIIDADHRVVRAQTGAGTRKFNLADGCRIVADGKVDTKLNRLDLGDDVALCYDDVNGVLVVNWISRESPAHAKATPEARRDTTSKTNSPGGS